MKTCKRFLAGALLAAVLLTMLPVCASASGYTDLPEEHWAYDDMTYAAYLGIINGVGDNRMAPNQSLTWGQCLTMVTRAFMPATYRYIFQHSGLPWDAAGLKAAQDHSLVLSGDFLPVDAGNLDAPITRQDMAVLLYRALPKDARKSYSPWSPSGENTLSDWEKIPADYREAVDALVRLRVIRGREDGSFGGTDTLQRCDGSALLMRTVSALDSYRRGENAELTLRFVGTNGAAIATVSAQAAVGDSFYSLLREYAPAGYTSVDNDLSWHQVSSIRAEYKFTVRPMTQQEIAYDKLMRGEMTWEEYELQDFWLTELKENARKHLLLFGDAGTRRYPDQATAKANMVSVTIPVWKLSKGKKVSSTMTLQVHKALAEDVKAIFTEIYNDPEQFPIYSIGGFRWKDGTTGEHNCGSAIDINPNENYQVREGKAETGKLWQPGVNAYSIPEDGSVVRIFRAHGWSWGGNAWAGYSDQTTGYHDYMHFSYMGG